MSGQPSSSTTGAGKQPKRGLGVAELELQRCGGDPLRTLSEAAAVMADAGSHYLPPRLVQQYPGIVLAPVPISFAFPADGQFVAPEQPFLDPWGRVVGGVPAANAGLIHLQNHLHAPAPEHQSTVWRPASTCSASCIRTGIHSELCAMMTRARASAAANMPDHCIYAYPAEEIGQGIHELDGTNTEIREIQFFPPTSSQGPGESEFPSTSSGAGNRAAPPLDLSLKL